MKKNRMMRIAAVMMVLALITTCVISGTFAKYVTTAEGVSDTARVAKWGVTVAANSSLALADTSYATDDRDTTITTSVFAQAQVVAPGTSKSGVALVSITGTPEVAVRVFFTGFITLSDNWKDKEGKFYCPLVITVGANRVDGKNFYDNRRGFVDAVNGALTASADYAPGTDLSNLVAAGKTVSWSWEYVVSDAHDERDTYLGNLVAAPTVSITLSASVTQID